MDDEAEVMRRIETMLSWLKVKGMAQFIDAKAFICVPTIDEVPVSERGYVLHVKLHGVHLCLVSPGRGLEPFFCFEDFKYLKLSAEIGSWARLHELVGL